MRGQVVSLTARTDGVRIEVHVSIGGVHPAPGTKTVLQTVEEHERVVAEAAAMWDMAIDSLRYWKEARELHRDSDSDSRFYDGCAEATDGLINGFSALATDAGSNLLAELRARRVLDADHAHVCPSAAWRRGGPDRECTCGLVERKKEARRVITDLNTNIGGIKCPSRS